MSIRNRRQRLKPQRRRPVLDKVQKLWQIISVIGGLGSITDITKLAAVAGKVWAAIGDIKAVRNAQDAFRVAISILDPVVNLTTNPWDDGLLHALRALAADPGFIDWTNDRMAERSFAEEVLPPAGIPEGALAIREPLALTLPDTAQTDVVAMPIIGGVGAAAGLVKLLPYVLALVELILSMRGIQDSDNE
jgi:hypothetical protein